MRDSLLEARCRDAQLWNSPDDTMVTTMEAASLLCRSKRTLEGWRLNNRGPAYCAGKPVTYSVGALRRFKMGQTIKPFE